MLPSSHALNATPTTPRFPKHVEMNFNCSFLFTTFPCLYVLSFSCLCQDAVVSLLPAGEFPRFWLPGGPGGGGPIVKELYCYTELKREKEKGLASFGLSPFRKSFLALYRAYCQQKNKFYFFLATPLFP